MNQYTLKHCEACGTRLKIRKPTDFTDHFQRCVPFIALKPSRVPHFIKATVQS